MSPPKRGRVSAAAKQVVSLAEVAKVRRPPAPCYLTGEQKAVWKQITESLPADWFPKETHTLLEQYCRHAVAARHVAQLIEDAEDSASPTDVDGGTTDAEGDAEDALGFDVDRYDKLLKMQEREGRALSSLATRMRLTQQATYHPEKQKGSRARGKKPFEFGNK